MPRYAFRVEYDGAPFAGWQAQADQPSVQGAIEAALAKLDPSFAAGARIAAAGRTDTGVHASGQVFHADLVKDWQAFKLGEALKGAAVTAKVVGHGRADKVRIVKFRRRKHHRKQMGHRQHYTEIEITGIAGGSSKGNKE